MGHADDNMARRPAPLNVMSYDGWASIDDDWPKLQELAAKLQRRRERDAQARWCLYCDSATHFSHECRSTHGINTPQAVELHRLLAERAALAARVGVLEGAQGVFERAADMLTAYAELIRRAGADRITDHHYLPEVEYVAKTLREAAPEPAPFVPDDSPSVPVEAAPETPAEPVAQEPRALADLPDSLRCHPGVKAAIAAARAEGAEQMRDVLQRCVKGIDHLSELARLWEPDHSSGADRRGWVLAKDARDDAAELLRSLPVEAPNAEVTGLGRNRSNDER